jgi:hypothetical protein
LEAGQPPHPKGPLSNPGRGDGKELFYLANDNRLMALDVNALADFQARIPKPLFELRRTPAQRRNHYVVATKGQRFLALSPLEQGTSSPIVVVSNWAAELKKMASRLASPKLPHKT